MMNTSTRSATRLAVLAAVAGVSLISATPAKAWVSGGVVIGLPPVVVAPAVPAYPPPYYYPPAYYYPPGYYAPPPANAPPAQSSAPANAQTAQANTPYGSMCYAGFYTCAAVPYSHVGSGCACPGIGAPSYGTVR